MAGKRQRLTSVVDRMPAPVREGLRGPTVLESHRALLRMRAIGRHYLDAVFPLGTTARAVRELPRYMASRRAYRGLSGERLDRYEDNPQLLDRTGSSPFDPHYTHQDAWAARELYRFAPSAHVDVGSRITFVLGVAAFLPVTFIDLRPLNAEIENVSSLAGSVLSMPFGDRELKSLSCLHVAEHVGLGRYGDPLDPEGTSRAARELARVLAPGGRLWFSLPVGRPRTNFNAHRVHDPRGIPEMFPGLRLDEFAAVGDDGRYSTSLEPADLVDCEWGCGLYRFSRDE